MAENKPPDASGGFGAAFVPEFVRKAAVAGLGALFLTEEGLRNLAGQLKLPKEMLGYLASQAERTKDEVTRVLSEELRRFLQSERLREEWVRLLKGMTLEVKAQIRLVPGEKPTALSAEVQVARPRGKKAASRRNDDDGT